MQHTRRDILRTASALTATAAGIGALGGTSAAAPDYSLFNDRGLWTWIPRQIVEDQAEQDRFFAKADEHGIGTLFAHYDAVGELEDPLAAAPDAEIEAFLRRAHDNDVEIHPMIGGGIAGWPAGDVYPHAEQAVAWNDSHPPEESFDGLHVDVENGGWEAIRDELLDRFDGYPDDLTISMAQHPKWVRHADNENLRTLMEHRNLDFYCTMVYDLNWATFWPNFGRSIQPWDTPYVLGQGGNEHGHPARNWSDADEMYSWVESNFVTGSPPTQYQYITEATDDLYVGFSLHSYWALIPAPRGETIGAPSQSYQTDPSGNGGGGGDGNTAPTASFTPSATTVTTGESVSFDASGSADPDGSITGYDWDFGDGAAAAGQTASHSYGSTGDYTVTLTVTDDAGATASTTATITVESGGGGGNQAPTASVSASPTTIQTGEAVSFDASGSSDPDGSIASYSWVFGDGASASGQTVNHSYGATGSYTATVTVTDDAGSTDTASVSITVESGGGGSCDAPAWDSSTAYGGGDRVSYDGAVWEAEWWTRGTEPTASATVWTQASDCGDGGGGGGGGVDCSGVAAWDASTAYNGGAQVTHDGSLWTAEWWTQGTEPAESENVWTLEGSCSGT